MMMEKDTARLLKKPAKTKPPMWQELPVVEMAEPALAVDADALQQALARHQAEARAWRKRYMHLRGSLEKTKKRLDIYARRRIHQERDRLLQDFLPYVDDLERVLARRAGAGGDRRAGDGLDLTLCELQEALSGYGVRKIEALHQPFDPKFHEARGIAHNVGVKPGLVIQVIRNGYTCENRLLRAAEVLVSA